MSTVASHWKLTKTNWEPSLKLIHFNNYYTRSCLRIQCQLFSHHLALKANWKGEKLDKCVPCKLTTNQKKLSFWSVISYSTQLQRTISQSDYDVQWKMDFVRQSAMTTSVVGLRRSSSALPKAKLAPKKGCAHCLVVFCLSDPLELSESWWNHYIWEVCSADQWDTLKTAIPATGIGQQKGPSSSPQQCSTACHTTCFKSWQIGLRSFASSTVFTWPLTTDYHFFKHLETFCRENASTTSRRQEMLSKRSLIHKACIFTLQE